jgi:2-amino-4-hydroxy-6-hydroxymethyldihydropteridine diphosphokinase
VTRAYIGLGANIGDAAATLRAARDELSAIGEVTTVSSLYRTPAWGVTEQPPFVNAVLALETALAPYPLLAALKGIETQLGRVVSFRWGPRAIDLDILTYGDVQLDAPDLTIPHARLAERAFVLVPLAEIDPAFVSLRDALPASERDAVERIGPFTHEEGSR